jgi:hypothetical protein
MEMVSESPVELLVESPSDDDFLNRYEVTDRIQTADYPFHRIIGMIPAPEGYLYDIGSLLGGSVAGGKAHKGNDGNEKKFPHGGKTLDTV